MYLIWADWIKEPFWGNPLGYIVIIGEIVCWCHLIFQSEAIAIVEDTTWTVYAAYMTAYSKTNLQLFLYGAFTLYCCFEHVPR